MSLKDALRAADPVAHEPELTTIERQALRRRILTALDRSSQPVLMWRGALVVAATTVVAVGAGFIVRSRMPARPRPSSPALHAVPQAAALDEQRRQLQFSTPGGTRIIWVFDPAFHP